MNGQRIGWLFAFASIAAGVASAAGGCGSDDSTAITGDADAAADGASGSSSGTTSSSSGSTSSTSSTSSSGGSSGDPDGGTDGGTDAAPNPDKISCGSTECDAASQVCCVAAAPVDGGTSYTCQASNVGCTGATVACDEKADCSGQDVCCTSVGGGALSSECKASCTGQDVQLCKSAVECGDGGACNEYTCPLGRKVRACTKPFGCN